MDIPLPDLIASKLRGHSRELGIVHSALASFGDWLDSSGTPAFFPDYTDHSATHIGGVLATAATMVPEQATRIFTAADSVLLVLATLLHDSAMHLAEPGFRHLVLGESPRRRVEAFDSEDWPELWQQFMFTAKRWDEGKLRALFGDEVIDTGFAVRDPFDRWEDLSDSDRRLIGEFIRIHHPRLAHEFALFGVPGVTADFLRLPAHSPEQWCDLAGVIARSHGLPIRDCLDYIAATGT